MNFFEAQDRAIRTSRKLVIGFILAIIAVIVGIYAIVWLVFASRYEPLFSTASSKVPFFIPDLFFPVALTVGGMIVLTSLLKIAALSRGGSAVARMLGGEKVSSVTTKFKEKQLLNVVEEMAIAAGCPIPEVYILRNEGGINAFAAGTTPSDSAIGITQGALDCFNREELQGVIAHEFSHIVHGDTRLNIRLIGFVGGLVVIVYLGRILINTQVYRTSFSRNRADTSILALLGFGAMIIGSLGLLTARILQSSISRQREFLADASAVKYTRNPNGIANALKKIASYVYGSTLHHPKKDEVAHLMFADGIGGMLARLFATHPPIEERIKRIDPSFTGFKQSADRDINSHTSDFENAPNNTLLPDNVPSSSNFIVNNIGQITPSALNKSRTALLKAEKISEQMQTLSKPEDTTYQGIATVLGLLLGIQPSHRNTVLKLIKDNFGSDVANEAMMIGDLSSLKNVDEFYALLIKGIAMLRGIDDRLYSKLSDTLTAIITVDGYVSMREYLIVRAIMHNLECNINYRKTVKPTRHNLRDAVLIVVSIMIQASQIDPNHNVIIAMSENLGIDHIELKKAVAKRYSTKELDTVIEYLLDAPQNTKQVLISSLLKIALHDGTLNEDEYLLLRILGLSLNVPMPNL